MTTRREAMLTLTLLPLIPACGGGGGSDTGGRDAPTASGCTTIVQDNHGHSVTVPRADVMAGAERSYTVGGGTHTHTLRLTAADFMILGSVGMLIATTSLDSAHSHMVEVRCG